MYSIDVPSQNFDVENIWQEFVRLQNGKVLSDDFGTAVEFANADFWFEDDQILIELKEIQTEFLSKETKRVKDFVNAYAKEKQIPPNEVFAGKLSDDFVQRYMKLAQTPIARILRKANTQIKETKKYLDKPNAKGIVVIVNDGFTSVATTFVLELICKILINSYSSINGFVLMTINSRVKTVAHNGLSRIWVPCYAPGFQRSSLSKFVNNLSREWRYFFEEKAGPFDYSSETDDFSQLGSMPHVNKLVLSYS